jgi:hypothetical protein
MPLVAALQLLVAIFAVHLVIFHILVDLDRGIESFHLHPHGVRLPAINDLCSFFPRGAWRFSVRRSHVVEVGAENKNKPSPALLLPSRCPS